jgi:hypothetical protein
LFADNKALGQSTTCTIDQAKEECMDSMDNFRERIEALEQRTEQLQQHTRTVERQLRWWRGIACGVLLLSLVSLAPPSQAADFACAAGDVACLIDAINQANANGEANTITLEAGTYTLTAVDNDTEGPNGLPSIIGTLTLSGAGADITIIERAASAPQFRLLHIAASGTLTLEGLTAQGGIAIHDFSTDTTGAGLLNQGTLTLRHSAVRNNRSTTLFARAGEGLVNTGTASLAHCIFDGNSGGIANGGTMTIHRCTFTNNFPCDGCFGGGISNFGTLLLTDSALTNNSTNIGGGIGNSGTLVVINSTLAHNRTIIPGSGGGLSNVGSSATVTLLNSTLVDNTAITSGGGVANGSDISGFITPGTVVLLNTFLARNQFQLPGIGSGPDCSGPITSLGHNLIGDPTGCTITLQPTDLTGDPGLDTFTDDGTPGNGHFPLLPTSQAIDAGNDAVCPRTDQLGQRRIGRCDIGAIRFLDNADLLQDDDAAAPLQATK